MVQGRTGYLVFLVCLIYLIIAYSGLKGMFASLIFVPLAMFLVFIMSPGFQDRVLLGFSDIYGWDSTMPSSASMGLRIEFIHNSLRVSSENLFFGVGIGNFYSAYGNYLDSSNMVKSANPHNQYILFLVEIGIIGLIAFLYLNYVLWKNAARLSLFWKHSTRTVLLGYGAGNLFNSFLTDSGESFFFSAFMAVAFSELLSDKNVKSTV
jgi:O-antigen ligase